MYSCQYRNGATVTVFVPYDCHNNCPFCVNKTDYRERYKVKDLKLVIDSMQRMHKITPFCDFVLTGGEPFADLDSLDKLISVIGEMGTHKLFINTTFPDYSQKALDLVEKHKQIITGINISRHLRKYVIECPDDVIRKLQVPVRINCVLYNLDDLDKLPGFVERFSDINIQLRENYSNCTLENLYDYDVNGFKEVLAAINAEFSENNMIFKNNFRWNYKVSENISYHRTLPYSTIMVNGTKEINDVIITPGGEIYSDWNDYGEPLDVDEYERAYKALNQSI